jgi:hypothetical protein
MGSLMAQVTGIEVKLDIRKLLALQRGLKPKAQMHIDSTAFKIKEIAQPLTLLDTGAARNAWYVHTNRSRQIRYDDALGKAKGLRDTTPSRHTGRVRPLRPQEVASPVMPRHELEAIVGNSLTYPFYHEFGLGPVSKPMLTPAVEQMRPFFLKGWEKIFK